MILIIIVVFVARKFASGDGSSTKTVASNASVKRHTDQELKNMSFDEWKELDVATLPIRLTHTPTRDRLCV